MTTNTEAPKPCPFCGAAPGTLARPDNIDGSEFYAAVYCHCEGYSATAHVGRRRKTQEEATTAAHAAWNTRAALAQQHSAEPVAFDAEGFRAFVLRELPDDTIIGKSAWWADHLTKCVQWFVKPATAQPAPAPAAQPVATHMQMMDHLESLKTDPATLAKLRAAATAQPLRRQRSRE